VPSARQPSAKPAATIVDATARTRSVIEDLQTRLTAEARTRIPLQQVVATPPDLAEQPESVDDLERELQAYFNRAAPKLGVGSDAASPSQNQLLDELRSRVIDGVVDRILSEWANTRPDAPQCLGVGCEVMDRLIERVLEEFRKAAESPKTGAL
jgi:hypothetical protein